MTSINLNDLSHATLVEHTRALQDDYNKLSGKYEKRIDKLLDRERENQAEIEVLWAEVDDERAKCKNFEEANKAIRQERDDAEDQCAVLYTENAQLKTQVAYQKELKNKHIDLNIKLSENRHKLEKKIGSLEGSMAELVDNLRDSVVEADTLEQRVYDLTFENETIDKNYSDAQKEIGSLKEALAKHPETVKYKVSMADLRHDTMRTMIRWGSFFASVCSICYFLA